MSQKPEPRPDLTHVDALGRVRMVDVGAKPVTRRQAVATGSIRMRITTLEAILAGNIQKGEVLALARVASIAGAKRTSELIPLCHPLPLDAVDPELAADPELPGVRLTVRTSAEARTGVEMEALAAVAAGLLTVYDMCKGVDRGMVIGPIRLLHKTGGASGEWRADPGG
jgi:cyclic pyranopterin phosphate synthase